MRTTVTFDSDVSKLLERARKEQKASFKSVVNDAVRRGLNEKPAKRKPYVHKTFKMGKPLIDLTNIGEALAILEGEDYR